MMNFGPSEARELTYYEYTGLVHEYNERHASDDSFDPLSPPDPDLIEFMKAHE